ncbi:hypothetical protein [Weissella cibaria]|uniref:hypothetical protein n=1 Tax=Weissella cibaria TaxID=137591 RepID=UPI0007060B71|nr:hypothetical protein [Weissella cibaria]ALI33151.1 hypothetical protein AO080_06675 [Weissella cibaria]
MAIAGVKPLDQVKTIYINPISGEPLAVNDVAADKYYDTEKVREILERYDDWIQVVGNDDVTGFMESGEE